MIIFKSLPKETPFIYFKEKYDLSIDAGQNNIDAICIASMSMKSNEVNARYVNLKIIDGNQFIFFSNYNSIKAEDFVDHPQISALIYWNKLNIQIRIKANIRKTSSEYNKEYFKNRDIYKNALAISSNQSSKIESYELVQKKYLHVLNNEDLRKCPEYWGGFSFVPYYFEFWEGHESRVNKRKAFKLNNNQWTEFILEP